MNNIEITNNYSNVYWRFIEEYLPNYYSRDDVLRNDILFRYIDDDDICDEDMQWILSEFNGEKERDIKELINLEKGFLEESLKSYYSKIIVD